LLPLVFYLLASSSLPPSLLAKCTCTVHARSRPSLRLCTAPMMADSDEEVNEYDLPVAKRVRVVSTYEQQAAVQAGEALDREELRALLGASTDSSVRKRSAPAICKPYGPAFYSLAGVLMAARQPRIGVEAADGRRLEGTALTVGRDFTVALGVAAEGAVSGAGAGAGAAAMPAPAIATTATNATTVVLPRRDVTALFLPYDLYVASTLQAYLKEAQAAAGGAVQFKKKQGARSAPAEHAPIGLGLGRIYQ
jgi:hypothetical protein